ncbi:hypothetical protein [Streptomyces sp. QHH-9511]|nr:hypothetical protein [Streptomyces sp. QHH-9511]
MSRLLAHEDLIRPCLTTLVLVGDFSPADYWRGLVIARQAYLHAS